MKTHITVLLTGIVIALTAVTALTTPPQEAAAPSSSISVEVPRDPRIINWHAGRDPKIIDHGTAYNDIQ